MTEQQAPFTTDDLDNPRPGYYRCRMVKDGPWVGVKITDTRDGIGLCVNGDGVTFNWDVVLRTWERCMAYPIDEKTYTFMIENAAWHQAHDPADPHARPYEAVDFTGHNLPPGDEIVAAERLVENAKFINSDRNKDQETHAAPPTADIAERAINATKQLRAVGNVLDDKIKKARALARAEVDDILAAHLHAYAELDRWCDTMQAIAHEARSASDKNITTLLGVTASQRETVAVEVVKPHMVPDDWWVHPEPFIDQDAILEAARAAHKAGEPLPEVPGVKITVVRSTIVK